MTPHIDWRGKHFSFFQNTRCEFFPCHEIDSAEGFNCLFCFCPLYAKADCGGVGAILANGRKDCSLCTVPHERENYGYILEQLGSK